MDMAMIDRWDEVERYLTSCRDRLFVDGGAAPSELWMFHDGTCTAVVDLPPFVVEDADRIIDALMDLVPQLAPTAVLVILPHLLVDGEDRILAMRVLRWTHEHGWRTQLWPTSSFRGQPLEGPIDLTFNDPYTPRLMTIVDAPSGSPHGIVDTRRLPGDMLLLAHPDGLLGHAATRVLADARQRVRRERQRVRRQRRQAEARRRRSRRMMSP